MDTDVQYTRSGDVNIAYKVFGDGPLNLVFVPGIISHLDLFWTLDLFVELMERFASFARVVTFDKRGTGLSDPTAGAAEMDERMDDVRAVMDAVGMEKAVILGVSEGAPMSVLFAATYPERTTALVLCGAFTHVPSGCGFDKLLESSIAHWGEGELSMGLAPSFRFNTILRRMVGLVERASVSPQMASSLFDFIRRIDVRPVLSSVRVPTLIVHRRNEIIPISEAEALASGIEGAKLVVLEGEDHIPWVGDVQSYAGTIEEFLTGSRQQPPADRALATVLFTDIVTSTERNADVGDAAWRRLLDRHNGIVRAALEKYRGREVKTMGDGFLAVFDGPARAMSCARSIVDDVREIGLAVRVGVHTGEVELYPDGDIGGMAVNIGARVGSSATAGEVLVSSTVKDLVVGSGFAFEPRGAHELKGVPGEWQLFSLRGEGSTPDPTALAVPHTLGPMDRASIRFAKRNPKIIRAFGRLMSRQP